MKARLFVTLAILLASVAVAHAEVITPTLSAAGTDTTVLFTIGSYRVDVSSLTYSTSNGVVATINGETKPLPIGRPVSFDSGNLMVTVVNTTAPSGIHASTRVGMRIETVEHDTYLLVWDGTNASDLGTLERIEHAAAQLRPDIVETPNAIRTYAQMTTKDWQNGKPIVIVDKGRGLIVGSQIDPLAGLVSGALNETGVRYLWVDPKDLTKVAPTELYGSWPSLGCYDTDNLNRSKRGITYYPYSGQPSNVLEIAVDTCTGANTIEEYGCVQGGGYAQFSLPCSYGCSNGACEPNPYQGGPELRIVVFQNASVADTALATRIASSITDPFVLGQEPWNKPSATDPGLIIQASEANETRFSTSPLVVVHNGTVRVVTPSVTNVAYTDIRRALDAINASWKTAAAPHRTVAELESLFPATSWYAPPGSDRLDGGGPAQVPGHAIPMPSAVEPNASDANCSAGCALAGRCYATGTRLNKTTLRYCDPGGMFAPVKTAGASCTHDYVCASNACEAGSCGRANASASTPRGLIPAILGFFHRLFAGG